MIRILDWTIWWKIYHIFFLAIALLLPAYQNPIPGLLILAGFFAILGSWKRWVLPTRERLWFLIGTTAFFAIHVVSYYMSDNRDQAGVELGIKLGFLFVPLAILLFNFWTPERFRQWMLLLMGSTTIIAALHLVAALGERAGWTNVVTKLDELLMHRAYATLFFNVVVAYCIHHLLKLERIMSRKGWILMAVMLFNFLAVIGTGSKNGMITGVLIAAISMVHLCFQGRWRLAGGIAAVSIILVSVVVVASPSVKTKFEDAYENYVRQETDPSSTESVTARRFLWEAATTIIKDNPVLGVGIGDAKSVQVERYYDLGYYGIGRIELDAHNQYLETGVGVGIVGITLLALMNLILMAVGLIRRHLFTVLFAVLFVVTCFTESVYERQFGILLFTIVGSLLISQDGRNAAESD